jgi:hypothetical protein
VLTDYPAFENPRQEDDRAVIAERNRFFGGTRYREPVVVFRAMYLSALVKTCGERATNLARQFDFSTF